MGDHYNPLCTKFDANGLVAEWSEASLKQIVPILWMRGLGLNLGSGSYFLAKA